jgi:hypothetical protein
MTDATPSEQAASVRPPLQAKDKVIIGLLLFFTVVALTLELNWLVFHQVIESRVDMLSKLFALYWPLDVTYRTPGFSAGKAFVLSLESVNTLVTPVLSMGLIWAILKQRPYRYALQLVIATYTFYGTYLYYSVNHLSGYASFEHKTVAAYLMFYLINLPWLAGYAWIGWDAYRAILNGKRA